MFAEACVSVAQEEIDLRAAVGDRERLLQGLDRLSMPIQLLEDETAVHQRFPISWECVDRSGESLQRTVVVAGEMPDKAEAVPCFRVSWIDLDSALDEPPSFLLSS